MASLTPTQVCLGGLLTRRFCFAGDRILGMRTPYKGKEDVFTEDKLVATEPISQFDSWFKLASSTPGIIEPNAMCLATASKDGRPSARMVLLKAYGVDGFKFFTNYDSRKGREIAENPFGSINFFWEPLKRCVRVEGIIEKLEEKEADDYFNSRPVSSRIGAAVSQQSQPIPSREYLDQKEKELQELADKGISIERPKHWGGFILKPDSVEFWQGQTNRIHDRIRFRKLQPGEEINEEIVHKGEHDWVYERLAP